MTTTRSWLAFWLTIAKAISLSFVITCASVLVGAFYGGLWFPFDDREEAFLRLLMDGATLTFLSVISTISRRMLRSVPRGFDQIGVALVISTMTAYALAVWMASPDLLTLELLVIGSVTLIRVFQLRYRSHREEAGSLP